MIKLIYEGLPDQGKSYMTARLVYLRLKVNSTWWAKKKTKVPRLVAINPKVMKLAPWVEKKYGIYPNGFIKYYAGLKELSTLRQCDVFLDDMGTQFAARRWQEMTSDITDWFRLMGHYECDVYGNAQDFLDIDVSIRRKTRAVVSLKKLFGSARPGESYPPIKHIYGVILQHRVHYSELDKEQWKRTESKLGWPIWISKFNCSIYDTLQKIEKAEYPPYECIERGCTNPEHKDTYGRPFRKYVHV